MKVEDSPLLQKSFPPSRSLFETSPNIHAKEICIGIYLTESQSRFVAHSFYFLYYGVVMGSWIAMFPIIIEELGITSYDFGFYLSAAG
jgi:hypothetical protein